MISQINDPAEVAKLGYSESTVGVMLDAEGRAIIPSCTCDANGEFIKHTNGTGVLLTSLDGADAAGETLEYTSRIYADMDSLGLTANFGYSLR